MYLLHCLGVIMQLVQGFIHHHKSIYHYLVLNNDKIIPSKLQKPYQVSHYLKHNTCRCHSILHYLKRLQIAISCTFWQSKCISLRVDFASLCGGACFHPCNFIEFPAPPNRGSRIISVSGLGPVNVKNQNPKTRQWECLQR